MIVGSHHATVVHDSRRYEHLVGWFFLILATPSGVAPAQRAEQGMPDPPLSTLAEQARAEFAGCLAFVQNGPASNADDLETRVGAFVGVAQKLQQSFEQAQQGSTLSSAELRSDIEALRRELREKGELIARQREQLLRWSAECQAIEAAHQAQLALPADDAPAAQRDG